MGQTLAEFTYGGIRILGFSMAGEETFVILPEFNLAFDLGRAPREIVAIDHVFLTHGHMDHAAGLAYYFSQRAFIEAMPGNLYLPRGLERPVHELLRIWTEIDGGRPGANIHVAEPGRDIEVRKGLHVRPFQVRHPFRRPDGTIVHALGFAVLDIRSKLIDDFQGLSGPQLVELKRQGVAITRRVEVPLVAFTGDTGPGDFFDLEYVANAKILIMECTFFEPDHVRRARQGNHLHVSDLRALLPRLRNEKVVLTHVSRRTAIADARVMLRKELGAADERFTFLMEHRRRRGRRPGDAARSPDAASGESATAE
jgi:ribonuclease Z